MLNLYKNVGETPLERIERFRVSNPLYKDTKLSYAGRLDPMAEGVLLIMEGEENKEREKYLNFDKEYETEIVFGLETDTYDALGLVLSCVNVVLSPKDIENGLSLMPKTFEQEYPPYSSKTVGGVPLFSFARKGLSVLLPKKTVSIQNISLREFRVQSSDGLLDFISSRVSLVKGDFRQDEILKRWQEHVQNGFSFAVATFSIKASSGFYVRSFAHTLGKKIGTGAIALSIKRTQAGTYLIKDSIK